MDDPLAIQLKPQPINLVSTRKVNNEFPSHDVPYKLAIIGEAPGADEEAYGRPFIGASGRLLDSILNGVGILRQGCFVGNICKYRPPDNKIESFGVDHPKVIEGWNELQEELKIYEPNCILALGNTSLYYLTNTRGILSWRGSILQSALGKVIPAIHPAAVLREYKQWVLLRFDALRARNESTSKELVLPKRLLETELTPNEICNRLDNWPTGQELSFDIEGGLDAFPCCSISDRPDRGFVIAWSRYGDSDQGRIYVSLSRILYRNDVPKTLQNSLYDRFVLAYGYRILIRNVREDTMLKSWEIYPELPKGLATQTSIWTREPFYKDRDMYKGGPENLYRGCIKDSCVTIEISRAQDQALSGNGLRHYRFNMELLSPVLYMELRGLRYDTVSARNELATCNAALAECASRLNLRAGTELRGKGGSLSPTRLKKVLYMEKGYPEQKSGRGPTARVTTDVEALLNLAKKFPHDSFISDILLHRKLESVKETLEIQTDNDGRVRCGYNLVGTETGRFTCYTSPTGSGANLQTITKKLRKLYLADEDHWLFQCDLSGADGWTVAAHCLRHGDQTMWDDYNLGLKPARIIALMYEHGSEITKCSREELKERCKEVDDDGWLYFACKRIQHASNYGVQERTVAKQIMVDSYKITGVPVYVDNQTCAALQRLYFVRYPGVYMWHHWAKREVIEGHNLTGASGHTRTFFGRRRSWDSKSRSFDADHETWKEFLADEPQENTTYATNLALHKLWHDPENRVEGRRLRIEPLHQVHDALIGQFKKEDTSWALGKIASYFRNPLQIANVEVTIPFEGHYGISWGNLTQGVI